jgi:hypothetical protein
VLQPLCSVGLRKGGVSSCFAFVALDLPVVIIVINAIQFHPLLLLLLLSLFAAAAVALLDD